MPPTDSSAEAFKRRDASSYDDVTDLFDHFSERFTAPVAERLADLASLGAGNSVLDVGTGTGILAFEAARRVGSEGRVVGLDLSSGMIAAARRKAESYGLGGGVFFEEGDAEKLAFEAGEFDRVISLYALLHFPHPEAALEEMYRVLRPGGKLAIAIGARPPLGSLTGMRYLWRRIPLLVRARLGRCLTAPGLLNSLVAQRSPDVHAEHGHVRTCTAANLPAMVARAGFESVRRFAVDYADEVRDPEEFWDIQMTFASAARKWLGAASDAEVASVKSEFSRRCKEVQDAGGRLVYPYAGFFVCANRPCGAPVG